MGGMEQGKNGFTIRKACEEDLASMVGMLADLFQLERDFTIDPIKQKKGLSLLLENENSIMLVATNHEGALIGMCTGQLVVSTAEGGFSLWVEDVFVCTTYRRQGIASRLLDRLGAWAKSKGASRLQLLADTTNRLGLDFYRKIGWKKTQLVCLRKSSQK